MARSSPLYRQRHRPTSAHHLLFLLNGGRVLRAFLAHRLGYARGTRIAASVGQAAAFSFGLVALSGNPLLVFIALLVYLAAASEPHAAARRQLARNDRLP